MDGWVALLEEDPRPWLRSCDEPAARWVALTHLDREPGGASNVAAARLAVVADPGTGRLLDRLDTWGDGAPASGHQSPAFTPNVVHLLADMGVGAGDSDRIERVLDEFMEHQDTEGRFESFGMVRGADREVWGALACDHHIIAEALIRFGRGTHPAVERAVERIASDLTETAQGTAWLCRPHSATGFRGPGRKADVCPQVTLEAARLFSRLAQNWRPDGIDDAVRTSIRVWADRRDHKPYMFGHGRRFKKVKWPTFWYDAHWVLDTVGRFPATWSEGDERRAVAEMAACLVAYNFGENGRVTPRSTYKGFETFSFGQKREPSPFATARLAAVLSRFPSMVDEIADVDVAALTGSEAGLP